jgi:putative transposase
MKTSKFTEGQIAFVLKQAEDGTPVAEVCRKAGIAEATFYNWRKRYAGLMASELKRLRQREEENAKLKRFVVSCHRPFGAKGSTRLMIDNNLKHLLLARLVAEFWLDRTAM